MNTSKIPAELIRKTLEGIPENCAIEFSCPPFMNRYSIVRAMRQWLVEQKLPYEVKSFKETDKNIILVTNGKGEK